MNINQLVGFTSLARKGLSIAYHEAEAENSHTIEARHLLLGIIQLPMGESIGSHILNGLGITADKIRAIMPPPETSVSSQIDLSESMRKILEHATTIAQKRGEQRLSSAHLLAGALEESDTLYVLEQLNVTDRLSASLYSLQICKFKLWVYKY